MSPSARLLVFPRRTVTLTPLGYSALDKGAPRTRCPDDRDGSGSGKSPAIVEPIVLCYPPPGYDRTYAVEAVDG